MNRKGFTISELLLVFLTVIMLGILILPFIRYSRAKMEKTLCANNLRQVGLSLYIYAREHGGNFPENLRTLYEEQYLSNAQFMDCPATKEIGTIDCPDYVYKAGLSVRDVSSKHLLVDKPANHAGGGNVLFVNADVEWEKS